MPEYYYNNSAIIIKYNDSDWPSAKCKPSSAMLQVAS
jgi:hypothetical protein